MEKENKIINNHIVKEGDEWVLYNHDKTKVLSKHKTKEGAEKQERAIQWAKHSENEVVKNANLKVVLNGNTSYRTEEGYKVYERVKIGREGEIEYFGGELGLPMHTVVCYRPKETLTNSVLKTFEGIPVIKSHPMEYEGGLTSKNYKEYNIGSINGKVYMNGSDMIAEKIIIRDEDAINYLENNQGSEVSIGFTATYLQAHNKPYDRIEVIQRGNHLALCERGKAGREYRINNAEKSLDFYDKEMFNSNETTKIINNKEVEHMENFEKLGKSLSSKMETMGKDVAKELSDIKISFNELVLNSFEKMSAKLESLEKLIITNEEKETKKIEKYLAPKKAAEKDKEINEKNNGTKENQIDEKDAKSKLDRIEKASTNSVLQSKVAESRVVANNSVKNNLENKLSGTFNIKDPDIMKEFNIN